MSEHHTGGCQCGQLRYEAFGAPVRTGICHCRYCQLRTGSAFGLSVYFADENLRVTAGVYKEYSFKTESGRDFTTRFCPECGTNLFWQVEVVPGLTGVAGGSFDPPTFWYDVTRETFTRSSAPFVCLNLPDSAETSGSYRPGQEPNPSKVGG